MELIEDISTRLNRTVDCPVCGTTKVFKDESGGMRRYCSRDCRERYESLRYHVDDQRRSAQRRHIAEWVIRHPDQVEAVRLRHAMRILENGPDHGSGRRFMVEGSRPFETAVDAFKNNWPIFEELPLEIRVQVAEYLGEDYDVAETDGPSIPPEVDDPAAFIDEFLNPGELE